MMTLTRLSFAAFLALSPVALAAQSHDAHEAPAAATHAPADSPQPPAHDAPAAHGETPDGQVGAHGGGHHGPAMKLFGREYGKGGAFLVQLLNFAVYGAGLFFLLKGALAAMFKSRKEELETLLAQAARDKAEGEAQMREMEAKMSGLEGELAGILSKAEADAEAEKERVLEAARAEAAQILAQAEAEIGIQKRQAEQELRALVAELAIEGAAQRLEARMQGADATKALDRAIQQIGGVQ